MLKLGVMDCSKLRESKTNETLEMTRLGQFSHSLLRKGTGDMFRVHEHRKESVYEQI